MNTLTYPLIGPLRAMTVPDDALLVDHLRETLTEMCESGGGLDTQRAQFFHQWLSDACTVAQLERVCDTLMDPSSSVRMCSAALIALLLRYRDLGANDEMIKTGIVEVFLSLFLTLSLCVCGGIALIIFSFYFFLPLLFSVEMVCERHPDLLSVGVAELYVFALNRRNTGTDRDKVA